MLSLRLCGFASLREASFTQRRKAAKTPEVREALQALVKDSRVMSVSRQALDACIGDLPAVCDRQKSFSLIHAPPYYHTDHDTIDKISRAGLDASVDFYMRLLEVTGAVARD